MKKYSLPLPFLFLFNPITSLLYSLFLFINKRADPSFYFALSLSLILIYFPTMYDTSNIFYYTYYNKSETFNEFEPDFLLNAYISLPIILGRLINIDFYYFYFFYVFISLYLLSKIIIKASENNSFSTKKYLFFPTIIILLFTFNYRDLMELNRNFLSYAILFYYVFCIRNKNILLFLFFAYFSLTVHFTSLVIWLVYLLSTKIILKKNFYIILLPCCIIAGFFMPYIMDFCQNIVKLIPGQIGEKIYHYIYTSNFSAQKQPLGPSLKKLLSCTIIVIFYTCSLRLLKRKAPNILLQLLLPLSAITLLFLQYITIFERLNLALTFLYSYTIIHYFYLMPLRYIIISLILTRTVALYLFIYIPIFLGNHSLVIPDSKFLLETEMKPFYYPTILLLDISNGYSDNNLKAQSIWGK